MTHRHRGIFILMCLILLPLPRASAQEASEVVGIPWTGAPGITETVDEIMARQRVVGDNVPNIPREPRPEPMVARFNKLENPNSPAVSQWPPVDQKKLETEPPSAMNPQTVGVSFLGPRLSESGFIPPDCMGDVSATQVLVVANGRIKVYSKTGVLGGLNVTTDVFFASVMTPGSGTSDPHIRYDRLSGRWFVVIIDVATPNRVLIAVSNTSTITNTSSFTFFQFQHDLVGTTPNSDTGGFADYPTLGVDNSALYIGGNIFNAAGTAVIGTTAYVVNKASLLASTLVVTVFRQIGGAGGSGAGPWTPQGVDNDDPSATEGYYIGVDFVSFSLLNVRRVSNPGGVPTLSGNLNITVPTTRYPILQRHSGAAANRRLDALDDRPFAAQLRRNKVAGTSSLWTAHNIEVNSSGIGTTGGGRNGARWYEIGNLTTTPTLLQSGTLFDPAATNPRGFWIPTVAMSGQGHMALGASTASPVNFAEIAVAGRLRTDALGSTQAFTLAQTSTTAYNVQAVDGQRWGDYSQVVVDPTDDQTLWTFQEYCDATNSWGVRVIQLIAPPPATPSAASPSIIRQGDLGMNVVITGTSVSGSGFFDPGVGFTNRISGSVSGTGVTVNSVTYTDPTHVTLNLTVLGSAPTGGRTVTITNPDAQAATSVVSPAILTVVALPVPIAVGVTLNTGWNMVSNPVTVTNDSVRVLYPTSTLDYAYSYSGGYVQDYTMENRKGYWETFPSAITQNVTGLPITRDTFNVVSGWNMVGSISNPVDTSTIVSIPLGLRASDWYGSNGAYFVATQLMPGKAYWVKTNGAGQFVLANPLLARAANVQLSGVNPADVLNTLTIADSRGHSQTLYFGVGEKKSLPVSMYAMPPMPPVGTFDARFSTADGGSMVQTHDTKVSSGVEFPVAVQSDAYPLTISWKVKNALYALTDDLDGRAFPPKEMRGEGSVKITSSGLNKFSVRLVGDGQLPNEFALLQNYPNPFNPSTTIKYDLPVDTRVSLKVFNIIGQEVLSLVNEEQKAGYKSVEWNASNFASGVYFYTIEAGQFRASKKLLLLR